MQCVERMPDRRHLYTSENSCDVGGAQFPAWLSPSRARRSNNFLFLPLAEPVKVDAVTGKRIVKGAVLQHYLTFLTQDLNGGVFVGVV